MIESLAFKSGFCQRRSKLDAVTFFKMILFDQMCIDQPSLEQHCISLLQDEGKKLRKQSLHNRFNDRAVTFLQSLFEHYLRNQLVPLKLSSTLNDHFSAIRLMDSTEFKLPECLAGDFPGFDGDGTKSCTQIQFEYDLLSGKINDLSPADARTSDFTYSYQRLANVEKKNLIIRDLGYSKIDSFIKIESQEAYYISRLHPQINIYEKSGENIVPLSFKTIVKRLKSSGKPYLDIPIYLGLLAKHPVRLTVNLLTRQATQRRLGKKIYRKNSAPEKYKYLSQLNVFITNVPKRILPADQIYRLYKVRWQIELVFKTWKSVLKIDKVRKMNADRFRCYLLGKLLWILINWEICSLFNEVIIYKKKALLSIYKCFNIIKNQVRSFGTVLFQRPTKLKRWLEVLYEILSEYGLKETRKGRIDSVKLLALKYV